MPRAPLRLTLGLLLAAAGMAFAQENVRYDYAQVLNVEPIYETLHATRTERQCDPLPAAAPRPPEPRGLQRVVGAVRDLFGGEAPQPALGAEVGQNCRMVPVARQFQRPIAYDVDYVYKGAKYRTRTTRDPGNRMRVRVSVTPAMAD